MSAAVENIGRTLDDLGFRLGGLRRRLGGTPLSGGPARRVVALLAAVAVWAVLDRTLNRGLPLGIVIQGVVFGSLYALVAIGIVLVYKANRVINFAQAEFGGVAAVLAIEFVIQLHMNYFLAIFAGLVISAVMGAFMEVTVIRRFRRAPRLIVAVATIGLAQILNAFSTLIPIEWSGASAGRFATPFNVHFSVYPVIFDGNYLLAMIVVPLVVAALAAFLRFSDYGVAIRASADNGDRAELLGIPVRRLATMVWAIAGLLSALAVILRVPILGFASFTSVSGGGYGLLLRCLAAAVIGGMTSLPVTAAAAIGLGVLEELGAWQFSNGTYVDGLLLVVILVALLLRRDRFNRALETGIGAWKSIAEVRPVPAELARLTEVRIVRRLAVGAALVLALALPLFTRPSQQQLAALIFIYGIVAVSLVVLTGWAGHISLGHFALVGFGAAITGKLLVDHRVDMFVALAAGVVLGAVVAFLVGVPALRIRGPYLAVTTLAFAVSSGTFFLASKYVPWLVPTEQVPRPALFGRISITTDRQMYYFCLFFLCLVLVCVGGLRRSRTGRAIIANRDNQLAAQANSIDSTKTNLVAFAISGGIAGLAGGLYVLHQVGFHTDAFNPEESFALFSMVVIGGLGSLPGAVLGAVYIKGAEYLLPPGWSILASGFGIVALLLFLPGGLGGLLYQGRDRWLRWVARRHHLMVPSLNADALATGEEAPEALGTALGGIEESATRGRRAAAAQQLPGTEPAVLVGSRED